MKPTPQTRRKLKKLAATLQGGTHLLIVLQNNPDPDALAAALALRLLAHHLAQIPCSIASAGVVGRAENRALLNYLQLNLRPLAEIDFHQFDRIALVDTQPGAGNNTLPPHVVPHVVIDHHPCRPDTRHAPFHDVRRPYGATATILTEYLLAADLVPDVKLATALLYGIRSDTGDLGAASCRADAEASLFLFPLANKRLLSYIQRGEVQRPYWRMLRQALENARVFPGAILTHLGPVENPDMIGEVADLLLRDEHAAWTLCCGLHAQALLLSLRTNQEAGQAHRVIRRLVAGRGAGGGHDYRAGGQIPLAHPSKTALERLHKTIRQRFLLALNLPDSPGEPLIP